MRWLAAGALILSLAGASGAFGQELAPYAIPAPPAPAGGFALRLSPRLTFTPQADVTFDGADNRTAAGATLSLDERVADRLKGLGVRDGSEFGDRGRWYLFAATSGRSVGLNMLRGEDGELARAGWSTDPTSTLVSDAQAGVGWRRGPLQASVGYLHREIKPRHGLMGVETKDDDLVAISFSLKPR